MKVRALGPTFALLEALGLIHWCERISSGSVATLLLELPAPVRAGGSTGPGRAGSSPCSERSAAAALSDDVRQELALRCAKPVFLSVIIRGV